MKKHLHIHIRSHAGFFTKVGKDAYVDWAIVLGVSAITAAVFIYFSVSLFLSVSASEAAASSETSGSSVGGTLDRADLAKLISDFNDKQTRTALFKAGYQGAPDPSGAAASSSPTLAPLPASAGK